MSIAPAFYSTPAPPRAGTLVFASQRRAVRRAIGFRCQVVRERDFKLIADEGADISSDGLLVYCDDRVLTGDEVIVTFKLPFACVWLDAEATVARVVHNRRPTDKGRCLGIELHSLDESSRRAIRTTLQRLPPPLPARDRRIDYAASVHLAALS
jgi:hypothetical protein